jgi:predicted metal-dependent hydrolase
VALSPEIDATTLCPKSYGQFITLYQAGEYWDAHEVLEHSWRVTVDQDQRNFFHGMIQLAAAFVHVKRGNMTGANKLLIKAAAKLKSVPSPYLRVNIVKLRSDIFVAARHIQKLAECSNCHFNWTHKPQIKFM